MRTFNTGWKEVKCEKSWPPDEQRVEQEITVNGAACDAEARSSAPGPEAQCQAQTAMLREQDRQVPHHCRQTAVGGLLRGRYHSVENYYNVLVMDCAGTSFEDRISHCHRPRLSFKFAFII